MIILTVLNLLISLTFIQTSEACELEAPPKYVTNYDGDTITFDVHGLKVGDQIISGRTNVRLNGIDAPEMLPQADCEFENHMAVVAQQFVERELRNASEIELVVQSRDINGHTLSYDRDEFGHPLVDVIIDKRNLAELLLTEKLAVKSINRFEAWCDPEYVFEEYPKSKLP